MQITKDLSTNFTPGNGQFNPLGFIIHGTLGSYDGAINWLKTKPEDRTPVSYSSAHYVIAKDGRTTQLVENKDISWHAGIVSNPTTEAQAVIPKTLLGGLKNPNSYFIGIENEWFVGDIITEAQYQQMVNIIQASGIKNPIILCHKQITDYKSDFMTTDGKLDMSVVNEIKRRLTTTDVQQTPKLSKVDVIQHITTLINNNL